MSSKITDSRLAVGCVGLPTGMALSDYFERLPFLESDVLTKSSPKPETLASWRKHPNAEFCLLAPPDLTAQGFAAPGHASFERFVTCANALSAEVLLFRTPPAITISPTHTGRAPEFFDHVRSLCPNAQLVWEPEGGWPGQVASTLQDSGVAIAYDPLANDPLEELDDWHRRLQGAFRYYRLRALGHARRKYETAQLEFLYEIAQSSQKTYIAFGHASAFNDALRFWTSITAQPPNPRDA